MVPVTDLSTCSNTLSNFAICIEYFDSIDDTVHEWGFPICDTIL